MNKSRIEEDTCEKKMCNESVPAQQKKKKKKRPSHVLHSKVKVHGKERKTKISINFAQMFKYSVKRPFLTNFLYILINRTTIGSD